MADAAAVETEVSAGESAPVETNESLLTSVETDDGETNTETETTSEAATDGESAESSDEEGKETGNEADGVAPDTYADFVLPEGVTMDESLLSEVLPMFKEIGATQEQAQKFIDLQAKQVQASSQKQVDTFNQLMDDWRGESKNDSEIGGDAFEKNIKTAQSAINKYGTPELKQLMEDHGVGNHPEMIRFMVKVGRTLSEDVPGATGANSSKPKDRISTLYPNAGK